MPIDPAAFFIMEDPESVVPSGKHHLDDDAVDTGSSSEEESEEDSEEEEEEDHDSEEESEDDDEDDEDDDDDGEDDDEEEDGDDDDDNSGYSDDSSEHSLGSFLDKMGITTPEIGRPIQRSRSMPNMMMQLEVEPDQANLSEQHQKSLSDFMSRMNNCAAPAYFQQENPMYQPAAPSGQSSTPRRSTIGTGSKLMPRNKSTGALDDIKKNTKSTDKQSPAIFFKDLVKGIVPEDATFPDSYWESYFLPINQERVNGYTNESVAAIRSMDVPALRKLAERDGPAVLNACSKQGESLLHVACRRGNEELVRFMVLEANVSVRIRDDWHKTALHDLCWNSKVENPSQFQSVQLLLELAPELLFSKDKRGFTALQYVPRDSWPNWCHFLAQEMDAIRSKIEAINFEG